jgi:hypothetical protein
MRRMYEPSSAALAIVKSRISPEAWEERVAAARSAEAEISGVAALVDAGATLDEAIRKAVPRSRRSWVIRKWKGYRKNGVEALIDRRTPREPELSNSCEGIIQGAREANPKVTAEKVLEILRGRRLKELPSLSTIWLHFRRVDARTGYAKKKEEALEKVEELRFAGGELLGAAELESGAISALTDEVQKLAEEATEASVGQVPTADVAHRDERGHFTGTYNRKRRRKGGERIAGYLRSAAEKAEGRVPSWPRFVHEQRWTLEAKLAMVAYSPLVADTKGWDALLAPDAAGLVALTGFAYQPSTLAKFTSALAISNAGPRLLSAMGENWHRVANARWGEPGAIAALYVDNHAKEVWTSLFTKSGKVSHLSRVMPCITNTYVHTGAGAPFVASVQSGSAPLAPRLLALVEEVEAKLGETVSRATIIDAEGSTFDVLEAFAKKKRIIVTPLRPSRAPGLELTYSPGSFYRSYREHDELRCATATLTHKSSGRSLELGALLVRRDNRESETVLLTTGLSHGLSGRELADLYFARWPTQENAFKEGAAVALNEHRGNCGQMVANIAVVTELERLEARTSVERAKKKEADAATPKLEMALAKSKVEHQRAVDALATRRRRLDGLLAIGRIDGKQFARTAIEHRDALVRAEGSQATFAAAQAKLKTAIDHAAATDAFLKESAERIKNMDSQRVIRQLDVALDSVLTAAKLTCALLITFALREYFAGTPMTPQTFASRIFGIRGRRELRPNEERIVLYENPRDPEVNIAIAKACRLINDRRLTRNGRQICFTIEGPPDSLNV